MLKPYLMIFILTVSLIGVDVCAKEPKKLVQEFCYALQAALICDNLKMRVDTESKIRKKVGGEFRGPNKPYNNDCTTGLMKAFDDENKGLCSIAWEKYGCHGTDAARLIQENHFRIQNAKICSY